MKKTCCLQKYPPERSEYRDAKGREAKRESS